MSSNGGNKCEVPIHLHLSYRLPLYTGGAFKLLWYHVLCPADPPSLDTASSCLLLTPTQVDNGRCVSKGGGLVHTGEAIEVLALPFNSVPEFVTDAKVAKSTGLMFGLLW